MSNETKAGNLLPKVFTFGVSKQQVRTLLIGNQPYFVTKDVCDSLGLNDASQAVERLDEDEKLTHIVYGSGQGRKMWLVNESGLYNLIFQSRKPEAKSFRKWVASEVLPAIRRQGSYGTTGEASGAEMFTSALMAFQRQIDELRSQFDELRCRFRMPSTVAERERLERMAASRSFEDFLEEIGVQPGTDGAGRWVSMREIMDYYGMFCKTEGRTQASCKYVGWTLLSKGYERRRRKSGVGYMVAEPPTRVLP